MVNRNFLSLAIACVVICELVNILVAGAALKPLYKMSTVAGGGFDDGLDAKFVSIAPSRVKFDRNSGNIYISDRINNRIRKFDVMSGKISTVVGNGFVGFSGDGQLATLAHINNPGKVEISSTNDIYFADTNNHRIRKVFANGTITTIAGCGVFGFDLEEKSPVSAFDAQINYPKAVLLSADEKKLYITDTSAHMIKALSFETGQVSIVAGSLYRDSSQNTTFISGPISLALSPLNGEIYFVDSDGIKKINQNGIVEMVAGGNSKFGGDGYEAKYAGVSPSDIEFLGTTNSLIIADYGNNRIRVIGTNGIIETLAGNGNVTESIDGAKALDSPLTALGVSTSLEGEVYFADYARVSVVSLNGNIRHLAGNGRLQYLGDGNLATQSQLFKPRGVAVSPSGELFISDSAQDTIRKVSSNGLINTVAGGTYPTDGIIQDDVSPLNTFLNDPSALEFSSSSGELFVSDSRNFRVRKISKENLISTIANYTTVERPHGIALSNDRVYVADSKSNRVLRIDKDGTVTTLAGNGTAGFSGDGGLATEAQLFNVSGVALLPNGDVLIADTNNHRIRKVNSEGIIQTIAGTGIAGFYGEGVSAIVAQLNSPIDIEVSPISGDIIIVDSNNHRIRKIDSYGNITTIAGTGIASLSSHGKLSTFTSLNTPTTLSISPSNGHVYIADYENRRIRKLEQFYIEKFSLNIQDGELRTEMIKDSMELNGKSINYGNTQVELPKEGISINSELSLATSVYRIDKSIGVLTDMEKSISSSIFTISILDSDCNMIASPFSSSLSVTFADLSFNKTSNYSCVYFNQDSKEWKSDGMISELKISDSNSKFSITCKSNKLSSFAVVETSIWRPTIDSSNSNTFRENTGLGTGEIVAIVVSLVGGSALIAFVMAIIVGVVVVLKKKHNMSNV